MAFEDGYVNQLNLGSESALEPATPTPLSVEGPPPGFSGKVFSDDDRPVAPPSYYTPSSSSLAGQAQEQSLFQKITGAMINAGTKPGEIPTTMKMQLAQAQTRHQEMQNDLAWSNYQRAQATFQNTLDQQKRDNITSSMSIMPNAIAQIRAAGTPELRAQLGKWYADNMNALAPGTGNIIDAYVKNPFHVSMWQALMADKTNPVAKQLRDLTASVGFEHVLEMPEGKAMIDILGHDAANNVVNHLPSEVTTKLSTGKMGESEFKQAFKQAMYDPLVLGWGAEMSTAVEAFLDQPEGQQFMVAKGVDTDFAKTTRKNKAKADGYITAKKDERFQKNEELIAFDQENPGLINPNALKVAKEQNAIAMGDLQKQTNPGENPNNSVVQRWKIATNFKYDNIEEALLLPEGPERQKALAAFEIARGQQDKAAAAASMGVKLEAPHDMVTHPVYTMDSNGNLKPVTGEVSERSYRTGKFFSMTDDQKQKIGKLGKAKAGGKILFDAADKAFKSTDATGKSAELLAENAVNGFLSKVPGAAATVAVQYPDIYNYISQRDSALGDYARSLGGEVGVLTDQDIARVVKMFPGASDSARTRKAKRKAFEQLIKINEDALHMVLVGNKGTDNEGVVTPEQLELLKHDPTIQQKIQGILGSVEGLREDQNVNPQATSPSNDKPVDKRTRAERLSEEMMKRK